MPERREANTARPEHSWIPFYRELAKKLANDGWRERQRELVAILKEMRDEGVRMHVVLDYLDEFVDPFTVFAIIARDMTWENTKSVLEAYKSKFELKSELPKEKPFVPFAYAQRLGFFPKDGDTETEVSDLWKLFLLSWNMDPFEEKNKHHELIQLIDKCTNITHVKLPKLSGGLYWINPEKFLKENSINSIIGDNTLSRDSSGEEYIQALTTARDMDDRSFPEINIAVYKSENPDRYSPNLWVVRGGKENAAVNDFLSEYRNGIDFNLESVDLSGFKNRTDIEKAYRKHNPGPGNGGVGRAVNQIEDFILNIKVGDYVLMPEGDRIHYGAITSRPYHDPNVSHANSRKVEWHQDKIRRSQFSNRLADRRTVFEITDQTKEKFLTLINSTFKMPEDSWVPFHLEVGQKLIDGKWPEHYELDDIIDGIRWADPSQMPQDYKHVRWSADPYSLYLAFNMRKDRSMRLPAYRKVKELLNIKSTVPSEMHEAEGMGVQWRWEQPLSEEEFNFVWDLFRFVWKFDPANCSSDDEREFIELFDRVAKETFLPGKRAKWLSVWLYWIDPTKYLLARRLDEEHLNLEPELGVNANSLTGQKYLDVLRKLRDWGTSNGFSILDVNRFSTTREMLGDIPPKPPIYTIDDMLDQDVFLERKDIERIMRILQSKKNLVLQGPPGVGKTFIARKLAYVLMESKTEQRITSVQFHQSYSYEDFVGGFRPDVEDGQMIFTRQDGPFLKMCAEASENPEDAYVILIDEINRGNLSRVFGELLMLIEADKRKPEFATKLQHRPDDTEGFFVPENVYIIGTMNLADRSLTGMNVAMRRRFAFVDLTPQFNKRVFTDWLRDKTEMPEKIQERINRRLSDLNKTIADDPSLGENYAVGHSFFCPPEDIPADATDEWWEEWYKTVVEYEIRPLLREYWFDNPKKANEEADKLLADD